MPNSDTLQLIVNAVNPITATSRAYEMHYAGAALESQHSLVAA